MEAEGLACRGGVLEALLLEGTPDVAEGAEWATGSLGEAACADPMRHLREGLQKLHLLRLNIN